MITAPTTSTSLIHQDTLNTQKNAENAVAVTPRETVLGMGDGCDSNKKGHFTSLQNPFKDEQHPQHQRC